jgi:hypothetical protein
MELIDGKGERFHSHFSCASLSEYHKIEKTEYILEVNQKCVSY